MKHKDCLRRRGVMGAEQRQRLDRHGAYRRVEAVFRRQKAIEQAVYEIRASSGCTHDKNRTPGSSYISDPTAMTAIRNMDEIKSVALDDGFVVQYPERWLKVISTTYDSCGDSSAAFRLRCAGRRWDEACAELHIGRSTYFTMLDDVTHFALAAACQMGLIRIV